MPTPTKSPRARTGRTAHAGQAAERWAEIVVAHLFSGRTGHGATPGVTYLQMRPPALRDIARESFVVGASNACSSLTTTLTKENRALQAENEELRKALRDAASLLTDLNHDHRDAWHTDECEEVDRVGRLINDTLKSGMHKFKITLTDGTEHLVSSDTIENAKREFINSTGHAPSHILSCADARTILAKGQQAGQSA